MWLRIELLLCCLVWGVTADDYSNGNTRCKRFENCSDRSDPVCGTDGITYGNRCILKRTNCHRPRGTPKIRQDFKGQCPPCEAISCSKEYEPVCGSNQETYSNSCNLKVANCVSVRDNGVPITQAHKGVCKTAACDEVCITVHDPVCGSDGNVYSNSCYLRVASCNNVNSGGPEITEVGCSKK